MSTPLDTLRRMTNEIEGDSKYTDVQLSEILTAENGVLAAAAAVIWTEKAAIWAALVDMQEGDSRRDLSDLMDNALKMADTFEKQAVHDPDSSLMRKTTVGRITRA